LEDEGAALRHRAVCSAEFVAMMNDKDETTARRVVNKANKVRSLLAGLPPDMQGAILCDLLATWLVGFPPQVREEMLEMHLAMLRPLIDVNDMIQYGPQGHPAKEGEPTNG
jgi:hypothetical protein